MEYILNSLDGGILKIELNRPQKRNALTLDMYTEFAELLNTAQTKPEIRVVLVSAAGDNYSAGNDLQDFLDHPPGSGDSPQKQMIDALRVLDKPLVGAVRGAAAQLSRRISHGGRTSDYARRRISRLGRRGPERPGAARDRHRAARREERPGPRHSGDSGAA